MPIPCGEIRPKTSRNAAAATAAIPLGAGLRRRHAGEHEQGRRPSTRFGISRYSRSVRDEDKGEAEDCRHDTAEARAELDQAPGGECRAGEEER
jgi:hypothetical protein